MPAHEQQRAADAPQGQHDDQCCVNCGVVGLPASYYRRRPVHGDYCAACYSYSSSHGGRARPEQLWQRQRHRMLEALDPNALRCTHCGRLPKEGELFHKCRHPRNGRPLCGTCHHYAWRKDGLMRPWELVARDPHMRDASGRPAQHAFHSGRPGTGSGGAAASAGAAGREEEEAAAAAGGGHRARRGRPMREMSEAEQEAWHASWQLPAGYLPAGAVPQERRAAERRPGATNAAGRGEEAQQEQQEQPGRRQQWQQLVAWDGEGEAGQQAVQQQEHGHMHVRPEDWEVPLHGARWEAPALPPAGRQRQQGGAEGGANAEQQAQPQQPRQQQQQPQQPQQQQSPPRQEVQRQAVRQRQPPSTPQQVRQRPAVRAPVALASLGLQEADLFGEATAARPRPQQPPAQQQQRVVVRHAAPVQAPSRSEMQALIQAEREAELRRVQQQLEAAMEAERLRQRAAASLGGAMRTARAGGAAHSSDSCDTWGAAVRGNLLGGEDGQRDAEWEEGAEEEWEEGAEEEWEEEEGQDAQQMQQQQEQQQQLAQQEQARERKRARRRRQRQRKRQRLRQQDQEEEEEEEEEGEGSGQERCRLSTQTLRELMSAMSPERVTAALEGELWQGKHPELQPLPASLRRKLGEGSCRFAGRTLCVSGIPDCSADVPFGQDEEDLVERTLTDALTACPWTIQTVHLFREQGSSTWEADVRFWNAQDAARVLRFKLGLKMLGSSLTLRPDPDEVQYERTRLWHAKRSAILHDFKARHCT